MKSELVASDDAMKKFSQEIKDAHVESCKNDTTIRVACTNCKTMVNESHCYCWQCQAYLVNNKWERD